MHQLYLWIFSINNPILSRQDYDKSNDPLAIYFFLLAVQSRCQCYSAKTPKQNIHSTIKAHVMLNTLHASTTNSFSDPFHWTFFPSPLQRSRLYSACIFLPIIFIANRTSYSEWVGEVWENESINNTTSVSFHYCSNRCLIADPIYKNPAEWKLFSIT